MKKEIIERIISVITGTVTVSSASQCFHESIITADSGTDPALSAAVSDKKTENPCNKQDDKEVIYDGKSWIQPMEWRYTADTGFP